MKPSIMEENEYDTDDTSPSRQASGRPLTSRSIPIPTIMLLGTVVTLASQLAGYVFLRF